MQITETILTQLTDTTIVLESVYQAIAEADPDYLDELATYERSVHWLLQEVPGAESYLQSKRQELASDIRFAMWQGFMWNLECYRNPVSKLLAQLDFEELCQESKMHALPTAQKAQAAARTFTQSLPDDKQPLLEPIIDHFAYLETYGYKLAHAAGYKMANNLLFLFVPSTHESQC